MTRRAPPPAGKWAEEGSPARGRSSLMWTDASYLLSSEERRGFVYRLWDEKAVVYVGQTLNLRSRVARHAGKPWWPEVAKVEYLVVAAEKLGRVEKEQIRLWSPKYNTVHVPVKLTEPETLRLSDRDWVP